jgi:5-methylcytosine-specific restriction endonuclease McrA
VRPDSRYPKNWDKLRWWVFKRDGYKCQSCGSKHKLECHHIKAVGMGGSHHPNNLITLCHTCHERKKSSRIAKRKSRRY